ncbi:sperm-associated antigen 16 protein-like [Branchiostoma lanceolatum]|uniref:sperm-associated antigen 16 protein-like n=1 Tax=Branchiostoma lanceolatum TaxID=7740 RepID=UPI003451FC9A
MADVEAPDDSAYYLDQVTITEDLDDDYQYEEVSVDEETIADGDEDLDAAVRVIEEASQDLKAALRREGVPGPAVIERPEVVDDFVRNYLLKMGMRKTLECFQTEWYELQQKGLLKEEDIQTVPDVYSRNQQLDDHVKLLRKEVDKFKDAANKAKDMYVKLRKERDFHRMHHKRVVQEKNKLVTDIKRLKKHYASYEPTLRQLKHKYETAMKEKMLSKLERDRAVGQVSGLQATLKNIETGRGEPVFLQGVHSSRELAKAGIGPTQQSLRQARNIEGLPGYDPSKDPTRSEFKRHPNDTEFPMDNRVNPYLTSQKTPTGHLTRTGGFRLTNTLHAHQLAISNLALHPRKEILVTTSDDHTWKMWAIPNGDIIMTGEGHEDWVSAADFHPSGTKLATTAGDSTVKVWDFAKTECTVTFAEHTHAAWDCAWHWTGDFLASCSMDNTSKVWDLNSERCRYTLRGHADSVNTITFLYYSNTLCTGSADKTISLWDARTGLCAQTFYGHMHSVNNVTFNLRGDTIASCDSYGVLKLWDVRAIATITSVDLGPHPTNRVAFDPSGQVLAVASNDGTVKMFEVGSGQVSSLTGHEDAVQAVVFDRKGEYLVSGGSDGTVRIWS